MPLAILEVLARLGVFMIEYVQKNWKGEEKKIIIRSPYDTPCTVDCKKRGNAEE